MRFEAQLIKGLWRVVVFDDLGSRVMCQAVDELVARETARLMNELRA